MAKLGGDGGGCGGGVGGGSGGQWAKTSYLAAVAAAITLVSRSRFKAFETGSSLVHEATILTV